MEHFWGFECPNDVFLPINDYARGYALVAKKCALGGEEEWWVLALSPLLSRPLLAGLPFTVALYKGNNTNQAYGYNWWRLHLV